MSRGEKVLFRLSILNRYRTGQLTLNGGSQHSWISYRRIIGLRVKARSRHKELRGRSLASR